MLALRTIVGLCVHAHICVCVCACVRACECACIYTFMFVHGCGYVCEHALMSTCMW